MRKAYFVAAVAMAAAGLALTSSPAQATSVTFTLTGGPLSIAQPGTTASLGAGGTADLLTNLAGSAITGALGTTTVTDNRGGVTGWTTTIATTAFTNGTASIPAANAKAWVSAPIVPTGIAVVTAGTYVSQATGLVLSTTGQNFVTASAVGGVNAASFSPSIAVSIPTDAIAGTYTGAVTQTVS